MFYLLFFLFQSSLRIHEMAYVTDIFIVSIRKRCFGLRQITKYRYQVWSNVRYGYESPTTSSECGLSKRFHK